MKKQTQTKAVSPEGTSAVAQPAKSDTPAATESKPKTPRLSPSLKAQADRMIAARDKKKVSGARAPKPPKNEEEELVVFAFRLSAEERELIHRAAGPARASKFVRALAIAAACHDEGAIKLLLQSAKPAA